MTNYKLYPNLPSALPLQTTEWGFTSGAPPGLQVVYAELGPSGAYYLNMVWAKRRVLINKEQMFKQKYEKYTKLLNRLTWLNACSSSLNVATGISSVATFATFIGLPVSISLGAAKKSTKKNLRK